MPVTRQFVRHSSRIAGKLTLGAAFAAASVAAATPSAIRTGSPTNDVLLQLVQGEDGSAVHSVMVGGRWAVRERKLQNIGLARLREEAAAATGRLVQAGQANEALYRRLLPVVQCFCPALMRQPYGANRSGNAEDLGHTLHTERS